MSITIIPCVPGSDSSWVQRSSLDGIDYLLTFRWSQRDGHWYLDIRTQDEVDVVLGRKLTPGWPLLRGVPDGLRPEGELFLMDEADVTNAAATHARYAQASNTGIGPDPDFSAAGLGTRWVLGYYSADEFTT